MAGRISAAGVVELSGGWGGAFAEVQNLALTHYREVLGEQRKAELDEDHHRPSNPCFPLPRRLQPCPPLLGLWQGSIEI